MKNFLKKIQACTQILLVLGRLGQYRFDCWINDKCNGGDIEKCDNGEVRIHRFPAGTIFSYKIICLKNNVQIDSGNIWTIVYRFANGKIHRRSLKKIFKNKGELVKIGSYGEEAFFASRHPTVMTD